MFRLHYFGLLMSILDVADTAPLIQTKFAYTGKFNPSSSGSLPVNCYSLHNKGSYFVTTEPKSHNFCRCRFYGENSHIAGVSSPLKKVSYFCINCNRIFLKLSYCILGLRRIVQESYSRTAVV